MGKKDYYQDHTTEGVLSQIFPSREVAREHTPELVFPERFVSTGIEIQKNERQIRGVVLSGFVPAEHMGKKVKLVESYHRLSDNRTLSMQEFYVEGERVLNQAVIRTE